MDNQAQLKYGIAALEEILNQGKASRLFLERKEMVTETIHLAFKGHADAQRCLGNMFYFGGICEDGEPNFVEAHIWYCRAAEQGNAKAMFQLGTMCYLGFAGRKKGEPENYKQSAEWFHQAYLQLDKDNQLMDKNE